jgi:hypothetical protein
MLCCTKTNLHPCPATQQAAACARLLHRACCQARPGLKLRLYLDSFVGSLPQLLKPGRNCGGWSNVRMLYVGV